MASAATIQHPTLGTVQGKAADDGSGVTQFLGVKYASLKDRFAPPELIKGDPAGAVDAKEFGPHVVCLPGAIDMEMSYIQQTLPKPANPPITSDTEGLNLNITVPPAGTPKPAGGFPVLAFIHGGGLFIGANWWPQYDFKRLVKFGAETGRPFIGVNIGYRLGIPGFLTSAEMRQAGYKANNGLRDQATALQWIKHHIAGFGGDPANVTAMGESAGGASALAHLQSPIPLFARIISMAGTPLMMQPLPPPVADHAYALVTAAFGLADLAPPARLAALRTLPVPDLLAKAPPGAPLLLVEDGDAVRATPSHARLAPSLAPGAGGWCAEILAGWCGADANILTHMIPALRSGEVARIFTASFEKSLAERPGVAGRLFEAYGIRAEGEAKGALPRIVALASDLLFRASARAYVDGWPEGRKAWLYDFEVRNPWEGEWEGYATHILDVAALFLNFEEKLPSEGFRERAREWAGEVLDFVVGRGAGWDAEREVRVFKEDGHEIVTREKEIGDDKLSKVVKETGVGFDVFVGAWANFMQGK